jgi:hypothetical protein
MVTDEIIRKATEGQENGLKKFTVNEMILLHGKQMKSL